MQKILTSRGVREGTQHRRKELAAAGIIYKRRGRGRGRTKTASEEASETFVGRSVGDYSEVVGRAYALYAPRKKEIAGIISK